MQIVIAPDKFKGTLTAVRAAEALTRGTRAVYPHATFALRPLADGGEGTLDAFVTARGARVIDRDIAGPLGDPVAAPIAVLESGEAVIEMATASGLQLIARPESRTAARASSRGTGELLLHALRSDVTRVVVGVGGSASTDGGTGAASALGWRFLDERGHVLQPGGASLVRLHAIEPPRDEARAVRVTGACDVDNPLVGARGAARAFAPQKGADAGTVATLETGLERLAAVVQRDLGVDVSHLPHGGAGGGRGAGLAAFLGATLTSGFDLLAEVVALDADLSGADMVVTGEGRIDEQSLGGKAPIAVARRAAAYKVPVIAVTGDLAIDKSRLKRHGIVDAIGLLQSGGSERATGDPEGAVERAIEGVLRHRLENARGLSLRRRSHVRRT
ncbi:MAG TPA: glycerate kinase [Actinomycetota bacterium]|nr:glycerate kinase [Actinomycetota bacterium]